MFLCLQCTLYADGFSIRAKAVRTGDVVSVKVQIKNPMIDEDTALRKKIEPDYISHVTAIADNQVILNLATGGYLNKNPYFKFKYKEDSNNDVIDFIVTKSNGTQLRKSFQIVEKGERSKAIPKLEKGFLKLMGEPSSQKLWKTETTKEAIRALYGSVVPKKAQMKVTLPSVVANYNAIPITIQPLQDFESFAIFIDKNPRAAVAVISHPKRGIIEYMFKLKMVIDMRNYYERPYTMTIVAKGRDGNFYQLEDTLNVAVSFDE